MIPSSDIHVQIPLIYIVESDDLYLETQEEVFWFDLLRDLDWRGLRPIAAHYYEALWQFNGNQARARAERSFLSAANPESQGEATYRLLFERATLCDDAPILHDPERLEPPAIRVDPATLRPGRTPPRLAGRAPKCFFAMFKAFMGVAVCGTPPEPEFVRQKLIENPSFARTCGFTLPDPQRGYRQSDIPSLRKLEQFDQIMSEHGLWGEAAVGQVAKNLREGYVKLESTLVHDTTHYQAFSSMQVVELPEDKDPSAAGEAKSQQTKRNVTNPTPAKQKKKKKKRGKQSKRKSHPKTTKSCQCKDRANCPHPWVSGDDGAGTVVKSGGKKSWGHKASTISFAGQEILLDAVAMTDAASHDSQSLPGHVARLFKLHPDLEGVITRVLDDGAADDQTLKDFFWDQWEIELLAPINPRRRGPITKDLPRGIDHITPTGIPVCRQGYPFEFVTCRHDTEKFVFQAPRGEDGTPVCWPCPNRPECYRGNAGSRRVTVGFQRLPWLDPEFPQVSKRFAKIMARRTVIERLHKLMKHDFGDERLTKRGTKAFQARLDKTLLAMHLALAHG